MPAKKSTKQPALSGVPKSKPVRVDLEPPVHKALRRRAAEEDVSMASLARRIIAENLGFKGK